MDLDPLIGRTLGARYRIERMLGRGGAGAVYEASQLDLDRRVAIKTLRPELSDDALLLERFRREARAAASLGHPHIAQVLDWGDPSATEPAFIAFELLRGESLLELLRREPRLSPARAVRLMAQILSALETAHRAGIVHRDLKPGNIMITAVPALGETAKLLDFGIAQIKAGPAYQRLTQTGIILGTPRYMAPEQLRGASIDVRTDVWAAGVVLHRMLTGKLPFDGAPHDVALAILASPLAPLPHELEIPPALEAVVIRALAKSPDERWPSALAMAEALEAALRSFSEPPRVPPVSPPSMAAEAVPLTSIGPAFAPVAPTASAPSRSWVLPIAALAGALSGGGCLLSLGIAAAWSYGGDLIPAGVGSPAAPSSDDYPEEGTLDTYLAHGTALVHAEDPGAVLDSAFFSSVDDDGTAHVSATQTVFLYFRRINGSCATVMLPPSTPPSPATCLGVSPLRTLPLASAIAQARAACPRLGPGPQPVYFVPFVDQTSVTVGGPSPTVTFSGLVLPDGTLGPMPAMGFRCGL